MVIFALFLSDRTLMSPRFTFLFLIFCSTINAEIPIIFIHKHNPSYHDYNCLEHSLWQAQQYNRRIILIGDESNKHYPGVEHYNITDYFKKATHFANIYVHLAGPQKEYELFCFQRWCILKEFTDQHKEIDRFFYGDSDLMIYADLTNEFKVFNNADICLAGLGFYSGHSSYWSKKGIDHFCTFMMQFYENKINIELWKQWFYNGKDKPAIYNVCDMALLTEYVRMFGPQEMILFHLSGSHIQEERKIADSMDQSVTIAPIRIFKDEATFDHAMGNGEHNEYLITNNRKNISWKDNQPYCFNQKEKKLLRFRTLHFQGDHKPLMKSYRKPPC